jgi:hypothetical protein
VIGRRDDDSKRKQDTLRLRHVEWLDPLVTQQRDRDIEAYVAEKVGSVPPHARYLAQCPWILRADLEFDTGCAHVHDLSDILRKQIGNDRFLDTVGTAALANMVCRVSMAIDTG